MPNKELRIIIADTQLSKLTGIEKSLNKIGYFRILPVQQFDDLRALDHDLVQPFDVMIANKAVVLDTEKNVKLFWRTIIKIDNVLLYDDQRNALSDNSIRRMMTRVDPAFPWECLKGLAWIKFKNDVNQSYETMQ